MNALKKLGMYLTFVTALALSLSQPAMADVAATVASTETQATTNISLVGDMLITLAGLALMYRWVKASFF